MGPARSHQPPCAACATTERPHTAAGDGRGRTRARRRRRAATTAPGAETRDPERGPARYLVLIVLNTVLLGVCVYTHGRPGMSGSREVFPGPDPDIPGGSCGAPAAALGRRGWVKSRSEDQAWSTGPCPAVLHGHPCIMSNCRGAAAPYFGTAQELLVSTVNKSRI